MIFDRWRATRPGNILDQEFWSAKRSQGRQLDFVQFTSPVTIFIRQPWFHAFTLGIGIFMALNFYIQIQQLEDYGITTVDGLQLFVFLNYDDQSYRLNTTFDCAFILLRDGCRMFEKNISWSRLRTEPAEFTFMTRELIDFDEIELVVNNFDPDFDLRANFLLEINGTSDLGGTWHQVGSSDFRRVAGGLLDSERIRFLNGFCPLAQQQTFDYRAPWPFVCDTLLSSLILAVSCLSIAACGVSAAVPLGRAVLIGGCQTLSLNQLSVFVGYLILGDQRSAFSPAVYFIFYLVLSLVIRFHETQLFAWMTTLALASMLARFLEDCSLYGDCSYWVQTPPVSSAAFLALGLLLLISRKRFLSRCVAAVADDAHRYDAAWACVLADSADLGALQQICEATERIAGPLPTALIRQRLPRPKLSRPSSDGSFQSHGLREGKMAAQLSAPVTSLDQLYAQALGLAPVLERRCIEWATRAGGRLRMPQNLPVSDEYPAFRRAVERGVLKSPARAIAKALSCYGGDVSRLLDVCRCRLAFRGATELAACLELVETDRRICIVRVSNTLVPGRAARLTAGFRVRSQSWHSRGRLVIS